MSSPVAPGDAAVVDARAATSAADAQAASPDANADPMRRNPDQVTLESCEVPEPCLPTFAQLVEGDNPGGLAVERFACTFGELARATPGRYTHETDATWSNGSLGAQHTLVLRADRTALYSRVPYGYGPQPLDGSSAPGQRCRLRPAAYFEACLAALQAIDCAGVDCDAAGAFDSAWECAFGDGNTRTPSRLAWFEACEEMTPLECE